MKTLTKIVYSNYHSSKKMYVKDPQKIAMYKMLAVNKPLASIAVWTFTEVTIE